jgi:hypothetical protein
MSGTILAAGAGSLSPLLLAAVLVPAGIATAETRTAQVMEESLQVRTIEELFFELRPVDSREILATLKPGEAFTLQAGGQIEVFAFARPEGGRDGDVFRPQTRFWLEGEDRDQLSVVATNERRGAVTIRAVARDGDALLHWQLAESLRAPRGLRSGVLEVRLVPAPGTVGEAFSERQARELWADLYRAILLREPDTFGGVELLRRDGYPALLEAARAIAESEESAIGVYSRGCNEQRLLALYRHLWGLDPAQIDRGRWSRDLDLLQSRRYAEVVDAFLRADRFFEYQRLDAGLLAVRRRGGG